MANTLTNIFPKILAAGLSVLREAVVLPRLVNTDYMSEAAEKGDIINIPLSSAVAVQDVTPGPTPPTPGNTSINQVQLPLDQWRKNEPFFLSDKEIAEIDRNRHFMPGQLGEAVRALAGDVNQKIWANYTKVYNSVGTPTTPAFATADTVEDAVNARKKLLEFLAPKTERRGVVSYTTEANMLALSQFSDADKIGTSDIRVQGEIGRKYGIDWFGDDDAVTHTAGAADGAYTVNGAHSAGVKAVVVAAGTGTFVLGDVFEFSNSTQQYTITDDPYAGGAGTINFEPALVTALAGAETVDQLAAASTSYSVDLVFHREAFAFASRPLTESSQDLAVGRKFMSMTDPKSGITLRLEILGEYKQTAWEFDILYGTQAVRPAIATRLVGNGAGN